MSAYQRLLAEDRDPEELRAGLSEWGSGEVRIADVQLVGPEGAPRAQFLAGEPLSLRLRIVGHAPAPRLTYELRDENARLLAGGALDTTELGWESGNLPVRFDVESLPLADGRFELTLGLTDADGAHLYHQLSHAASFLVYGGDQGPLLLDGRWSRGEVPSGAEVRTP
jgi:hypothetical protein